MSEILPQAMDKDAADIALSLRDRIFAETINDQVHQREVVNPFYRKMKLWFALFTALLAALILVMLYVVMSFKSFMELEQWAQAIFISGSFITVVSLMGFLLRGVYRLRDGQRGDGVKLKSNMDALAKENSPDH